MTSALQLSDITNAQRDWHNEPIDMHAKLGWLRGTAGLEPGVAARAMKISLHCITELERPNIKGADVDAIIKACQLYTSTPNALFGLEPMRKGIPGKIKPAALYKQRTASVMLAADLTVRDLAQSSGLPIKLLTTILEGGPASFLTVIPICKAVKISPNQLLGFERLKLDSQELPGTTR